MSTVKKKKVLIIAPQPFFSNRGTPINVRALASVLGEAGFAVDLLVFPLGEDVQMPGVRLLRCANPFRIKTVPIGPSWRKLLLDISLFAKALRLVIGNRYHVLHGVEEGGMLAYLLSLMFGTRFVYDVDSDIPEQLEQKRYFKNKLFISFVRRLERRCLQRADAIITVCPALTTRAKNIVPDGVVYEVRDFPVEERCSMAPGLVDELFAKHGLGSQKMLLYTGNLQRYQGLDLLISAFGELKKRSLSEPVALVIVGGDADESSELEALRNQAQRIGVADDVYFLGHQPIEKIAAFLERADVLVSPRIVGVNTPLKIYSYMASGKPIVATDIQSHTQVLDSSVAYLGAPDSVSFADALFRSLDPAQAESRQVLAERAQSLAKSRFSRERFRSGMLGIYYSITSNSTESKRVEFVRGPVETLVTGAGGFVGTRLVQTLIEQGVPVRAMVRSPEQASYLEHLGAQPVVADITKPETLAAAFEGITRVYHIAALFRKAGLPDEVFRGVNVDGTENVFAAALRSGVTSIVHCSTVGVHGDVRQIPATENTEFAPGDIYQQTKLEGELVARRYFDTTQLQGAIIRPGMIYGPGDTRTLKMFKAIARRRFFYVGSGDALVHFVDVRDLARGFILAMDRNTSAGNVYILSGREARPLNQVARLIAAYFNVQEPWLKLPVGPMRALGGACEAICTPIGVQPPIFRRRVDFFTKNRSFDWSKARSELGYYPQRSLEEEIEDICAWYIDNGYIRAPRGMHRTSTMLRDLNGNIAFWDTHAESKYGWTSDQAVGVVSHSLLRTEFPDDLQRINQQLLETKLWEGELVHTTRSGAKIRVFSRWERIETSDSDFAVLERNTVVDDRERKSAAFTPFILTSLEPLLGQLGPLATAAV